MRMSFSRLAAIGLSLLAGVTLASCASSSAPLPATGPNPQTISFPGGAAHVRFIQGSPNLNLGITVADLYIDGTYAGTFGYFTGTTTIYNLPIGVHDFKLTQTGTLFPVFLEKTMTFAANNKYAVIAEGDAGFHTTQLALFIEPHYNTPVGTNAISFFNASPKAGTVDFYYNCPVGGPACKTKAGSGVIVGTSAAPTASWKTNVILVPSTAGYCFAPYFTGGTVIVPGAVAIPGGSDPGNAQCPTGDIPVTAFGSQDVNFYLLDAASVPPLVPPGGPSMMGFIPDSNG